MINLFVNKRQVTLISSSNINTVSKVVIDRASETAAQGSLDPVFIIVPDRASLQAEKMLLQNYACLLNVRVVTFSMLFNILYDELGVSPGADNAAVMSVLDKTSAVLFMWRAIGECKNDLVWFGRSVGHYSFAEKMFNTVNQLASSRVDFDNLAQNARAEITRKKMHDISIIYRAYKKLIAGFTDSSGMLGYLIENIRNSQIIKSASVFITGFPHLSIQRSAVVTELIKHAKFFTAGYQQNSEFENSVTAACFEMGVDTKIEEVVSGIPADTLADLFRYPVKKQSLPFVNVAACDTVQDEAVWVANQICALIKGSINDSDFNKSCAGGVRFRDIVVALADFENSAKIFNQVFSENNIAVNVDIGEDLLQHPLTLYLKDCLALAAAGKSQNIISVLKNIYSPLSAVQEFELENFCLKTNASIEFLHKIAGQNDTPELNEAIVQFNSTVYPFIGKLGNCKTAAEFSGVLNDILVNAVAFCQETTEVISEVPHGALTSVNEKLHEEIVRRKLEELLTSCSQILGAQKMSSAEFGNMFCTLAAATKVSQVPTFADAVTLVPIAEYQPVFTNYLFAANITDGLFPIHQNDTDIITESDITNMTVQIEPTAARQNSRNRQHALNILTSAYKKLFISYAGSNSQNENSRPSEVVEKILAADSNAEIAANNSLPASKTFAANLVLRAIGDGSAFQNPTFYNSILQSLDLGNMPYLDFKADMPNISDGRKLFFIDSSGTAAARVTQLENFYKCPYYHFLQNGLKIRLREKYQIAANIMGTLLHKIVEEFTNQMIAVGRNGMTVFDAVKEVAKIVDKVLRYKEFSFFASDPVNNPIISNLKKECKKIAQSLAESAKDSIYFPHFTEKALEQKFGEVTLRGKADRIDAAEIDGGQHAIIIDYKTGRDAKFSMNELNQGIKLQLPLYASFLPEGYVPDGFGYLPLSAGYKSKAQKLEMKIVNQRLTEIMDKSKSLAQDAIEKIMQGYIQPNPVNAKVCRYCVASASCFYKDDKRRLQDENQ